MKWIVIGEKKGLVQLVSKSDIPGILPKGSYLTVEQGKNKFILRVDDSIQHAAYSPSTLIADMNLEPMEQDRKCQNIIYANRIKDLYERDDGLIDYIKPLSFARRSSQEEIEKALGNNSSVSGPQVFLSTIHFNRCQLLSDENRMPISVTIPEDAFFHQILIAGKTGSGKTVASKYFAQYFTENMEGAVLAINVKDTDFLLMDQKSKTNNPKVLDEWKSLNLEPKGIKNLTVYFPANISFRTAPGVTKSLCRNTVDLRLIITN